MSEFNTFSGKTVDDAINEACRFFATERDKLEVEILSGGSTGIFGLVGKKKAQVRARRRVDPGLAALIREEERKEAQAAKPERAAKPSAPARGDSGGKAPRAVNAEQAAGSDSSGGAQPRSKSSSCVQGCDAATGTLATDAQGRPPKSGAPGRGPEGGSDTSQSQEDEVSFNRAEPPVDQDTLDAEDERAAIAAGQKVGQPQPQGRREDGRRGGQQAGRGRKPHDLRQERQRRKESQPRGEAAPGRESVRDAGREPFDAEDALPEGQDQSPASPELLAQVREVMARLLTPILEQEPAMEIEGTASRVNVLIMDEEHSGLLIGREGQTLAALQYLANRIVARMAPAPVRVQINTGEYREKQDDSLRKMALYLADKAKNLGRPQSTKPLSSYHRRVIHLALQADETIQTRSKGEGPMKRVIIVPRRPKAETQPR
jgi:spoIIIJ-associated protein